MLVHPKNSIGSLKRNGVVNGISCSMDRPREQQMTKTRKHQYALTSGYQMNSAVAEHAMKTRHNTDWKNLKISSVCKERIFIAH